MDIAVSWRNIWRNKRRTAVILTAILIGIASMIFFSAFSRGMMAGMVDNAIDELTGHIKIQHRHFREDPSIFNRITDPDRILEQISSILPEKTRTASRIVTDAVVNTARDSTGVKLAGIRYSDEKGISFIGDAPVQGRVFADEDRSSALMGTALADKLGLTTGKRFVVSAQNAQGEVVSRSFAITGLFRAEMEAVEKTCVFVSKKSAAQLLGLDNAVTEISMVLPDRNIAKTDLTPLTRQINDLLDNELTALTWRTLLPAIDAYLSLFTRFLFIWYLVVFIAMGFGIVNTVLMAVFERMREFGLLKAIGMKPLRIFNMVVVETVFLLMIGLAAGNLAAFFFIFVFSNTGIDLSAFSSGIQMWGIQRVIFPVIDVFDIILANLTVFVLGIMVGVYPAVKAARFSPVETMRMN
ncbi:MAG: ABC transporter permease [Desulfotignum sp.]|nr:ABC transporter permease [Desulfotignum sp.]MCF8089378.1 ABC transporter permease [Desulfotignum sp.]